MCSKLLMLEYQSQHHRTVTRIVVSQELRKGFLIWCNLDIIWDSRILSEIQEYHLRFKMNWLLLAWHAASSSNEWVPCQGDAKVVPVDPGEPGGQVGGVPLQTSWSSKLSSETLLDVDHRLQLAVENLPQQRDVGDRQPQRVDLSKHGVQICSNTFDNGRYYTFCTYIGQVERGKSWPTKSNNNEICPCYACW